MSTVEFFIWWFRLEFSRDNLFSLFDAFKRGPLTQCLCASQRVSIAISYVHFFFLKLGIYINSISNIPHNIKIVGQTFSLFFFLFSQVNNIRK